MSLNSVGDADLAACFGPTKSQFGNALQKVFVNNMVVKTQNNATVSIISPKCPHQNMQSLHKSSTSKYGTLQKIPPLTVA